MGGEKRAAIVACPGIPCRASPLPRPRWVAHDGDVTVAADVPNASESSRPPGPTNDPATNVHHDVGDDETPRRSRRCHGDVPLRV